METDTPLPADWAIITGYRRAFPESMVSDGEILRSYKKTDTFESRWAFTTARLIEQHEQPPVDRDVEAVKRIINAYVDYRLSDHGYWDGKAESLNRAVTQYKQEVENRG